MSPGRTGLDGVYEVETGQCPGYKFRKLIFIGTTSLDPFQIGEFMARQYADYRLTGNSIPKWVNPLARIAAITQLVHHGMLYVPIGYSFGAGMFNLESIRGSPYGAGDGTRQASEMELVLSEYQGKYMLD